MTQAYTNAQKLAAVLNSWGAPFVDQMIQANMQNSPVLSAIENKVRATGLVSSRWSLGTELTPLLRNATEMVVEPILSKYLGTLPDESIPGAAHAIVDNALQQGELSLFEGKVIFDQNDLKQLKRLLQLNLPVEPNRGYEVITEQTKTKTKQ